MEFLVERYDVPIDSGVYVWLLSFSMGLVASLLYLQTELNILKQYRKFDTRAWTAVAISLPFIVILTHAVATSSLMNNRILSLLAVYLAAFNYWGLANNVRQIRTNAIIWLSVAIASAFLSPEFTICLFAISIISTFTIPLVFLQIRQKHEIKQALSALDASK